tara:strand:+ start:2457 stop:2963 length:507 start_codon:yes stop_codon:yes gene_type:complete
MNQQKLYLSHILPYISKFKCCAIYSYEIKQIEQTIAESINKKNIHNALDVPDFRYVKDTKVLSHIIKLCLKKLNFDSVTINTKQNLTLLNIENQDYQLITFASGELPKINIQEKNLLFFMYQPGFKKVYYCGKFKFKDNSAKINSEKFHEINSLENTQYFINFKELIF